MAQEEYILGDAIPEGSAFASNLDVMHKENDFFDNIINTIFNVQGKTKDNKNSRLDLSDIFSRRELHINNN